MPGTRFSEKPALLGGSPVRTSNPPSWPLLEPMTQEVLRELAANGEWGRYHGPNCPVLVDALCELQDCEFAVLCASGTAAVELALRGLNVGAGDEVVMAAYDFKSNFQNILTVGATPVLVDVRADDLQIDVSQIAGAISDATKAILVSHLHGAMADLPAIRELADGAGLPIIEDACQMSGGILAGRVAGSWGDVGVLSFGGSKLLTAGRGGAIVTNREDVVQRMRLYTQRGNEAYPLSEIQAALLHPQLLELLPRNAIRSEIVAELTDALSDCRGLTPLAGTRLDASPSYYKVGFWYEEAAFGGLARDRFAEAVRAEGFPLDPGFRSLHRTHASRRFRAVGPLPVADLADGAILTLHHPILLEQSGWPADFARAVEKIRQFADDLRD